MMPEVHLLCPVGPLTSCLGDGLPPIRDRVGRSRPCRAPARAALPTRPHAGRGVDSHDPACPRPSSDPPHVPTRSAGSQGDTCPQRNAAGSRPGRHAPSRPGGGREDQGRASPHHVEGAVTVEVTAYGVKRSRSAGPAAARGPTRRGYRPARPAG